MREAKKNWLCLLIPLLLSPPPSHFFASPPSQCWCVYTIAGQLVNQYFTRRPKVGRDAWGGVSDPTKELLVYYGWPAGVLHSASCVLRISSVLYTASVLHAAKPMYYVNTYCRYITHPFSFIWGEVKTGVQTCATPIFHIYAVKCHNRYQQNTVCTTQKYKYVLTQQYSVSLISHCMCICITQTRTAPI